MNNNVQLLILKRYFEHRWKASRKDWTSLLKLLINSNKMLLIVHATSYALKIYRAYKEF